MSNPKNSRKRDFCSILLVALLVFAFATAVFPEVKKTQAATDSWTLVTDARAVKAYPELREYVWQKIPNMLPNGQYDKIGLHRLVKNGIAIKGAVFIHEASLGSGDRVISNPPSDSWTKTENYSQAIYWANRGFEVYSMDSRPHFIPSNLSNSQLAFMQNYGWDVWISDMKEAVNKIKDISGFSKIFWVAQGAPAVFALNYATLYGKQDLKGLIFLDADFAGRPVIAKRGNETNTYNLTQQINTMITNSGWTLNLSSSVARAQYALDNPGAPAQYPPGTNLTPTVNPATNKAWTNITEYMAYSYYNSATYGTGGISNLVGGYGNITVLLQYMSKGENFVSNRYPLEIAAMIDWVNCPYVTYDFDDHWSEIDVPVLAIASQMYSNRTGTFKFVNGLATSDFTTMMLPNYGLYDLIIGTNSAKDVSQPVLDWMVNHSTAGWTLTTDARSLKGYPALQESIWQKTPAMPPNGQYDKIALHRLVKPGTTTKGVIFICPRAGWSAEVWISNPTTDNYTKTENNSQPIYWANRGYDVFAIDYRTHFVPSNLTNNQLAFMQNWTYNQWVSDIKEAVDKTKEISGAKKVFIAGPSNGGGYTMCYASKYWQEDLRGIILLDALILSGNAPIVAKNDTGTSAFNLTKAVNDMITTATWSTTNVALPARLKYSIENPGAPAEYPIGTPLTPTINPSTNKPWTNITEWNTYTFQSAGSSNLYEGYGNVTELMIHLLAADPYFPKRITLEGQAMADWTNCTYVNYDFDDHFNEINVPVLAFATGSLYSNKTGTFRFVNGMATSDFTGIMLQKYGHTDVYMGTYSARDVSQPTLDWILSHYQPPSASAFCSVTITTGQTWYFFAHSAGSTGPNTYQWYEGTTPLSGQTSMILAITKTTAGTYTYTCKVTDAEGTTATSNTITLTVINK